MRKTFQLHVEGKHPDRHLEAVKHEIRKYLKRERRRELPEGADYWDFDCRFGASREAAEVVHLSAVIGLVDAAAKAGEKSFYLELLARPAARKAPPPKADGTSPEPS